MTLSQEDLEFKFSLNNKIYITVTEIGNWWDYNLMGSLCGHAPRTTNIILTYVGLVLSKNIPYEQFFQTHAVVDN